MVECFKLTAFSSVGTIDINACVGTLPVSKRAIW
ncbi:hypothetical protein PICSAR240_02124 [Mycobacterium avium subsp. paratuberculosis]|nr:hypothetical protein B0172_00682 [Mycobacterium avium subsp. paratuberculosis]OVF02095.1 hypothetical protein B0173_03917 [Mycobacterium avium subsp. paratuberculosis]QKU46074.1 hypothetical protein MAP44135_2719 [Mycobacterium avium subsp. paratuberculosis]CAG6876132.1 hypothetical protein PICSAR1_01430 [Mycobacterium avium subsp. paratuberculosis]CAG6878747.1 hypothetical protein PICSAR118_01574 [Mycobacterium avium subsp. paratuberculosis]